MTVSVHGPECPRQAARLERAAATLRAEALIQYISGLACPNDQKIRLIDELIRKLREF